ncbi:MAG: LbtU family siderophore porin [Desulfotignum sp.]
MALLERFTFVAEYAAALDHFKAGEIYDAADTQDRKPAAWNLELGFSALENLDLAIGYGGSDDGGTEFLPEKQYGAVANWGVFDNTNLALEFLRAEFDDDAVETDTVTLQLAIEF